MNIDNELDKILKKKLRELLRSSRVSKQDTKEKLIYEATDETFDELVIEKSKSIPVIVDFWAAWCGPCLALSPILEKIVYELNGAVVLVKVNVDKNPILASKFGIMSIPTVLLFKHGRPIDSFVGALPEKVIRMWLKKYI